MALLNPVHGLVVPFLCLFTIPLAIFAGITTTLAFTVLMFRVAVVYLDVALAMVPQYFKGHSKPRMNSVATPRHHARRASIAPITPTESVSGGSGSSTPSPTIPFPPVVGTPYPTMGYRSHHRRKSSYGFGGAARHSRRSSQVSLASLGAITPIHEGCVTPAGMTPSVGIDRDYEGIGGWRLDDQNDDDWTNINSRLELPLERPSFSARRHQRSQSAGPTTPGDVTWLMMMKSTPIKSGGGLSVDRDAADIKSVFASPNSKRLRSTTSLTIKTALESENDFFPALVSPNSLKKQSFST